MIIEDQKKQLNQEIKEKRDKIDSIKPSKFEEKKLNTELKNIKKKQANETLRVNEINSKNKQLKREIDTLRKEIKGGKREIIKIENGIRKYKKEAKDLNQEFLNSKKGSDETNNQILSLKQKHESEKMRFEEEIKNIQHKLKQKDETEEISKKNKSQNVSAAGSTNAVKAAAAEFSNPITILKRRLSKIQAMNAQKKKLIDQYIKNVKVIQDAFEHIKEATGIVSTDEIVTTFVKAEEQNYSLYNYVNRLNQETDQLEEASRDLRNDILDI